MEYIKKLSNKILPDSKVLENDNTIQINNIIQDSDYMGVEYVCIYTFANISPVCT